MDDGDDADADSGDHSPPEMLGDSGFEGARGHDAAFFTIAIIATIILVAFIFYFHP